MSETAWLVLYCLLILCFSLFGGWFPFLTRPTHGKLQLYLSASAGVMLGASFFHVMPDAMEKSGAMFGWWMALAVVGLFSIERFLAPHTHEVDHHCGNDHNGGDQHADHDHDHDHDHGHNHGLPSGKGKNGAAAPALAGWMAVLGLTIHTFTNGVGLAGSVQFDAERQLAAGAAHGPLALFLPGIALFIAIFGHKPADALAISTVLSRRGVSARKIALVQLGFALMVPVGVVVFKLTEGAIEESLRGQLTGAALAFSAGTFLFIALSDLLPEVQFHRHDRVQLFSALVAGVVLMGCIALFEPHEGEDHPAAHIQNAAAR
jgi:zinc and cadmium transporter